MQTGKPSSYVRWFKDLRNSDVALVGGKNASLGEMYAGLTAKGVRIPNGFALTAAAYRDALTEAGAWPKLHALLDTLDKSDVAALERAAAAARSSAATSDLSSVSSSACSVGQAPASVSASR